MTIKDFEDKFININNYKINMVIRFTAKLRKIKRKTPYIHIPVMLLDDFNDEDYILCSVVKVNNSPVILPYICNGCEASFTLNEDEQPYCPVCGNEETVFINNKHSKVLKGGNFDEK